MADVEVNPDSSRVLDKAKLIEAVKRCDILLSLLHDTVDRDVLTANPKLKAVSSMNITQDRIDLAAATELGIPVTNIPAIVTDATADIGFGLLLSVARNIALGDKLFRAGVYPGSQSNHLAGAAVTGSSRPKPMSAVASVTIAGMLVTGMPRAVASARSMRSCVMFIDDTALRLRIGRQHVAVHGVVKKRQQNVAALHCLDQLVFRQHTAGIGIDFDVGDLAQPRQGAFGDRLGDENARPASRLFRRLLDRAR